MGSWAATCAVSNLAINPGDKVFYIFLKRSRLSNLYDLKYEIWRYLENVVDYEEEVKRQEEFRTRFNDSDYKSGILELFKKRVKQKPYDWGFGTYDDYGGVDGVNIPDKYKENLVLIRKNVADQLYKMGKRFLTEYRHGSYGKYHKKAHLDMIIDSYEYCLVDACYYCRIQIFGHTLLGQQYPDSKECREMLRLQFSVMKETFLRLISEYWDEIKYSNFSLSVRVSVFWSKLFRKEKK